MGDNELLEDSKSSLYSRPMLSLTSFADLLSSISSALVMKEGWYPVVMVIFGAGDADFPRAGSFSCWGDRLLSDEAAAAFDVASPSCSPDFGGLWP